MAIFHTTSPHRQEIPITKFDFERAQLRFAAQVRTGVTSAIDRARYVSFSRHLLRGDLIGLQLAIRSYTIDSSRFKRMIDAISQVVAESGVSLHCNFLPRSSATTARYVAVLTVSLTEEQQTVTLSSDLVVSLGDTTVERGTSAGASEEVLKLAAKRLIRFFNANRYLFAGCGGLCSSSFTTGSTSAS